ncbi:thioredoxin fold domain-containing protein [Vibrio metschnikovii]|uniref:thioredoxin fold domain-containing protein n=1 Tax=Vibrio metschnikovii TaxID=28172 RepID=UPI001C2F8058|nr:thioredoxin fold domain-containing protein [Vibrio metschnikovii]
MKVLHRLTLFALPFFTMACHAQESKEQMPSLDKAGFEQRFAPLGIDVTAIVASEISGLVEVQTPGGVLYASPDGKHFIAGTLYALKDDGSYVDVLAKRQAPINAQKLQQVASSTIEFKAPQERYIVSVFTDTTCGYCVRLHSQIKDYNDLGITIRYLAFPRQGVAGPVAEQMAAMWCASDPKQAMHEVKIERKTLTPQGNIAQCKQTIAEHYQLGQELGISGTPAMFLPSGEMIGGYLPAAQLLQRLQQG